MAKRILTQAEAEGAIYLDFEGTKTDPPSLVGILWAEGKRTPDPNRLRYQVDLLEPGLAAGSEAAVNNGQARLECRVRSWPSSIGEIVGRAEKQARVIVSWSFHDLKMVLEHCDERLAGRFEAVHVNAIPTASRWKDVEHPEVDFPKGWGGKNALYRYMDLIGYERRDHAETTSPAEAIRRVRKGLAARGEFASLLPSQKDQWLGLIEKNFHDCAGMRQVVLEATRA